MNWTLFVNFNSGKMMCMSSFKVMNLNFATNFVILTKHFELLNKYLQELVVKWNLFESGTKAPIPDFGLVQMAKFATQSTKNTLDPNKS